jgi:large subunit ribosomal protein L10
VFTTKDPVPVAKALQNFVRTNPLLTIKVGFVEGKLVQPAELKALADLPSREALRSQLVGALQGPASQLVTLLTAPQRELVRVLEARSQSTAQ